LKLLRYMLSLREDKISKIELTETEMKDPQQLDSKVKRQIMDERLYEERLSVQILNGTSKKGLAQQALRYVENLGGRVVGIGNTIEQGSEKSYILARNTDAYTVSRLAELFGIAEVREYTDLYGIKDRADVSIVIGLDLAPEL